MSALTQEQIETLEATHKRVAHLKSATSRKDGTPDWEAVLRRPTRTEYKMFRSMAHDPVKKPEAQELLTIKCCVWPPTRAEVDALLDEWPGIPEAASEAIQTISGMKAEEVEGNG